MCPRLGAASVPGSLASSGPPVLAFSPGAVEGPKQGGQGPPVLKLAPTSRKAWLRRPAACPASCPR